MKSTLLNNETLLIETNYHWSTYLKKSFYLMLIILLIGYLINYFLISFILAALVMAYKNVERKSTKWIVTNKRVVFEKGLFSNQTSEININKITSVDFKQSFREKNWGYGTIIIKLGNKESYELKNISKPAEFKNAISSIIHLQ